MNNRSSRRISIWLGCTLVGACVSISVCAQEPVKKLILPGESFLINDRPAFVMLPTPDKQQSPQAWVMYAPTLPGLPDKHEKWMHQQFLDAGIAVCGIDVGEGMGSPASCNSYDALYRELVENRGFAKKCCLLGRSRGGLWNSSWAVKNPKKVAGFAGIYPVFDLTAWPGIERAAQQYGLSPQQLRENINKHNPVEQIEVLAKNRVPVFLVHGDVDKVVPLKRHSEEFMRRYKVAGAENLIQLQIEVGQGHNYWPGFFRCQPLIDFVITAAKAGAQ